MSRVCLQGEARESSSVPAGAASERPGCAAGAAVERAGRVIESAGEIGNGKMQDMLYSNFLSPVYGSPEHPTPRAALCMPIDCGGGGRSFSPRGAHTAEGC